MLTPDLIAALILRGRAYRAQLVAALTSREYKSGLNVNWDKPAKIGYLIQALNFCLSVADYSSQEAIQVYDNLSQFLGNMFLTGVSVDPDIQAPNGSNITIINPAGYISPISNIPWSSLDSSTQTSDGGRSIYYNPAWAGYNPILSLISPSETALTLGVDYTLINTGGIQLFNPIYSSQSLRSVGYERA